MRARQDKRPQVFEFHDYRAFLKDWLLYLRSRNSKHSMRGLAREMDLSCAYLPSILSGKRKLSEKGLARLVPCLRLLPAEKTYFELLVRASENSHRGEREKALEEIQQLKAYRMANPRESETFRYLTRWLCVAIRELAALPDFRPEPAWIQRRLLTRVSPDEVRVALRFLLAGGFLVESEEGGVRPAEKDIRCEGSVFRAALRQFHREMIQATLNSVDLSPAHSHLVLGHTVALTPSQFLKVREILSDAIKKVEQVGERQSGSAEVFHITVLSGPLTQLNKETVP